MPHDALWPPQYTIRESKRARCVRLRVLPHKGLELVFPCGADHSRAAAILEHHKVWVVRALAKLAPALPQHGADAAIEALPAQVRLHGGRVIHPVIDGIQPPLSVTPGQTGEPVVLKAAAYPRQHHALARWVQVYACRYLGDVLHQLADEHGFSYAGLKVRRLKSRWGSCTVTRNISLNSCLVFLPDALCRYVLLHELAHTRACNHGQQFWRTLFAVLPQALELDKRLRHAWRYVPQWVWV